MTRRLRAVSAAAFPREPEAATAGRDKVDNEEADEVIGAIAKTVAEMTSKQDTVIRQQLIEELNAADNALVSFTVKSDLRSRLSREALT